MGVPGRPYRALRHRDFRRLWAAQLVSVTGSQMQTAAIHWHVWLLTGSPLALGLIGLVRVAPIVAFSLLGGLLADRKDRRHVMLAAQSVMTVAALLLALLTLRGREPVWALYALTALSAAGSAFDSPARQALLPRLVPAQELSGAVSLNLAMFHAAMIGGPALAGLLIGSFGSGPAGGGPLSPGLVLIYGLNALSFAGVLGVVASMRTSGAPEPGAGTATSPGEALVEGLRFVFRTPIMVGTMVLDFFATFFAGALSLLPVFADEVLGVGPRGYGVLAAAPALGALVASVATSVHPLPERQGRVLLGAVAAYGGATVVFGLSRNPVLTFLALSCGGFADLVSTVIRQTLRQLLTPDALRGRMTSVNMVFFMGGPQLGELEAGLVASIFASAAVGATVSVVAGGVATLLLAGAFWFAAPAVREYRESDALSGPRPGAGRPGC